MNYIKKKFFEEHIRTNMLWPLFYLCWRNIYFQHDFDIVTWFVPFFIETRSTAMASADDYNDGGNNNCIETTVHQQGDKKAA